MVLPKRKPTRLGYYDYRQNGYYFVTICAHKRAEIFSSIVVGQGLAPAEIRLTEFGNIIQEQLLALETRYPFLQVHKYVIMPNHIHAILILNSNNDPGISLSNIICSFKSLSTRACKKVQPIEKIFQSSFHDHIIRNQEDYSMIWQYIETNPIRWREDCFYSET